MIWQYGNICCNLPLLTPVVKEGRQYISTANNVTKNFAPRKNVPNAGVALRQHFAALTDAHVELTGEPVATSQVQRRQRHVLESRDVAWRGRGGAGGASSHEHREEDSDPIQVLP